MKTNFFVYASLGWIVALVSLLAFGFVVRTDLATAGKVVVGAASATSMFAVFFVAARAFAFKYLFFLCLSIALGAIVAFELLAFTVFPGFAKDMDLLSVENLANVGVLLGLVLSVLVVLMVAALGARRVVTVDE